MFGAWVHSERAFGVCIRSVCVLEMCVRSVRLACVCLEFSVCVQSVRSVCSEYVRSVGAFGACVRVCIRSVCVFRSVFRVLEMCVRSMFGACVRSERAFRVCLCLRCSSRTCARSLCRSSSGPRCKPTPSMRTAICWAHLSPGPASPADRCRSPGAKEHSTSLTEPRERCSH